MFYRISPYKHITFPVTIIFLFYNLVFLSSCLDNPDTNPTSTKVFYPDTQFVMGVDLSYVNAILEQGTKYRDSNGIEKNPYDLFQKLGSNVVRVRKWHTPSWQTNLYGSIKYHEKNDVLKTILEAKKHNMKVLLDLHYSDNWADPLKQETPKAWQGLPLQSLRDSVYQYTLQYLHFLQSNNATPEYIQIGNENNGGMCYPVGRIDNNNFSNFVTLLAAGSKAVRDFSNQSSIKPNIIIHVAQFQSAKWWIEGILKAGIPFEYDILGVSHYYKWSEVNDWSHLTASINDLISYTKKDLMVLETAFPWTSLNKDNYSNILNSDGIPEGYSIDKTSQNKYLKDLTQAIIDGGGKGVFYWEPAWISSPLKDQWGTGSSWENNAFFDFENRLLNSVDYMTFKYTFE
ncbi:MAG: glycosyl hydrolase 53 family protein [Saprospiraceae bacterium]